MALVISLMRRASCSSVIRTRSMSLSQRMSTWGDFRTSATGSVSDVLRVMFILGCVTAVLAFEIHLVLFDVSVEDIVGAHAEHLRKADEKVEEVHDFNAG